jgi:hypothetical protein
MLLDISQAETCWLDVGIGENGPVFIEGNSYYNIVGNDFTSEDTAEMPSSGKLSGSMMN